ncbi:MAG: hypothetical protein ACJAX8_001905, partial [Flavobacteriales bacterium]
ANASNQKKHEPSLQENASNSKIYCLIFKR